MERLRQIPPETGRFLALMAVGAPHGRMLEIGTSAGYSTLWIALAARERGDQLTTFEVLPEKARLACQTFATAEVEDVVELIEGDARSYLPEIKDVAFCFLDAEKEVYSASYDAVIPNMVSGGLLLADNAINHQETLQPFLDHALADERVDALVVPIGKGVLLVRKR
jgi:predicted O-methyltransferase YrrM